jgi:hypothetical protein
MNRLTRIVLIAGLASGLNLSITAAASANTATIGSALTEIPTRAAASAYVPLSSRARQRVRRIH